MVLEKYVNMQNHGKQPISEGNWTKLDSVVGRRRSTKKKKAFLKVSKSILRHKPTPSSI